MDKKYKIFISIFFSIILILIIIFTINYSNEKELNDRIEKSKTTKTLSINNISTAITLDELFKIETSKEYIITGQELKFDNDPDKKDFSIKYTNTSFYGSSCIKDYFFVDEKLSNVIFDIDTSHWMPKNIYDELVKINGDPDKTYIENDSFWLETHIWYGKNGCIVYNKLNNDTIEVRFELL